MTKLPVSVCMISGAEAGRIARALESVAEWAAEIIVVLNEDVSDGTEEIARKHGAKVFREPWRGFGPQKQSAADKAAQQWLLGLDADEVVSPELRAELEALFADRPRLERFAAFSVPRLSWYCGRWIRHGDWYPDRSIRLWRRGRGQWEPSQVHEKLRIDGPVGKLRGPLHHYSRESIDAHLGKIIPFSNQFLSQHAGTRKKPGVFDLAFRPLWRFGRAYLLRRGFLDGWPGYYIACHTAFSTLVRYAKLREAMQRADAPR